MLGLILIHIMQWKWPKILGILCLKIDVSTRPNKFEPLSKENGGKQIEFIKMEVLLELKKCKRKFDLFFFPEKNVVILNTNRSYKFPVVIYIYIILDGIPRCLLLVVFFFFTFPKEGWRRIISCDMHTLNKKGTFSDAFLSKK